ncbi:MAG: MotA/TolQ/ExbB proton channel family protein [Alphaproteobacteria bacterium]|nr:MotA/TolQ/ExbB proton channel family protein [Alphaproteobacteria bacterium]
MVRVDGGEGLYLFEGEAKRATPEPPKTLGDQLRAGGVVGYVILALGAVGVLLAALRALTLVTVRRGALRRVIDAVRTAPLGDAEDHAAEAILLETPRIERFSTPILVIAAVSPLLGLLGTVTGMIATFEILTTFGTGDPRMLSGGISEALVTTQLGLIVAIPMLLVGNLLDRAGSNLLTRLESAALATLNARPGLPDPEQRLAAK